MSASRRTSARCSRSNRSSILCFTAPASSTQRSQAAGSAESSNFMSACWASCTRKPNDREKASFLAGLGLSGVTKFGPDVVNVMRSTCVEQPALSLVYRAHRQDQWKQTLVLKLSPMRRSSAAFRRFNSSKSSFAASYLPCTNASMLLRMPPSLAIFSTSLG